MICYTCFKPTSAFPCVHCLGSSLRHMTGADAPSMIQNDAQVAAQPTTSSDVKYTGWDDLELLFPPLWAPWLANKIAQSAFDPSQEDDPSVKRRELAAVAKQLNTVIETCSKVPQTTRDAWVSFSKEFIIWFNQDVGLLDKSADALQAGSYQDRLRDWQVEISKYCPIGMPFLPKATPKWGQIVSDIGTDIEKTAASARTIFIVGALLVVGLIFVAGVGNVRSFAARRLA